MGATRGPSVGPAANANISLPEPVVQVSSRPVVQVSRCPVVQVSRCPACSQQTLQARFNRLLALETRRGPYGTRPNQGGPRPC